MVSLCGLCNDNIAGVVGYWPVFSLELLFFIRFYFRIFFFRSIHLDIGRESKNSR